jgi:hypothetical protein
MVVTGDAPSQRDPRVDVLRGLALLTIFIDHVPGNALAMLTLRNFGFADAAELFVILAGLSCMRAYGGRFEREGMGGGLRRITLRCLRLYAYQAALLVFSLVIVNGWSTHHELHRPEFVRWVNDGMTVLKHGMVLQALPSGLDILPLYIVLLCLFPLIYAGMRLSKTLTLAVSGSVWMAANLSPDFNLTNWMDGRGWFFNPLAWQFLFVCGIVGGAVLASHAGSLPRWPRLEGICWAYIALGVLAAAPWSTWGLWDFQPFIVTPMDETNLSLFRLLNILALMYLALSSDSFSRLTRSRRFAGLEACGKHSLEIFSLGTLLALTGTLLVTTFGATWQMQLAIDGAGLGTLLAAARVLETGRIKRWLASLLSPVRGHRWRAEA